MKSKVSLLCGVPPNCDRCCSEMDAKVQLLLPIHGTRMLCERCLLLLVVKGLDVEASTSNEDNCANEQTSYSGHQSETSNL